MSFKTGEHRIYMNVGAELSEEPLREYFSRFGRVLDVYLPRNKNTNAVMGYGFTTFESREEVDKILEQPEHLVAGHPVRVNRAGPRPNYEEQEAPAAYSGPHGTGPRLYVGGVPGQVSEEDLKEHFGAWGRVSDVYFPPQKNGRRSSYCFVRFGNYQDARRAYTESQRRIKGVDIEAINMAKDRSTSKSSEGLEPVPMAASMTRNHAVAIPREITGGGAQQIPLTPVPMVNVNPGYVPMATMNSPLHTSVNLAGAAAMNPLLMNGGVGQGPGPMVKIEPPYGAMIGMTGAQNVHVQSPNVVAGVTAPGPVLGLNTFQQQLGPGIPIGMPTKFNTGVVNMAGVGTSGVMVPMVPVVSMAGVGGSSQLAEPMTNSLYSGVPNSLTRIGDYNVSADATAVVLGHSANGSNQPWACSPGGMLGRADKRIQGALMQPQQTHVGGFGPQRNIGTVNRGFSPY